MARRALTSALVGLALAWTFGAGTALGHGSSYVFASYDNVGSGRWQSHGGVVTSIQHPKSVVEVRHYACISGCSLSIDSDGKLHVSGTLRILASNKKTCSPAAYSSTQGGYSCEALTTPMSAPSYHYCYTWTRGTVYSSATKVEVQKTWVSGVNDCS